MSGFEKHHNGLQSFLFLSYNSFLFIDTCLVFLVLSMSVCTFRSLVFLYGG